MFLEGYIIDWGAWATLVAAVVASISVLVALRATKTQEATIAYLKSKGEEEFAVAWTKQVVDWANECSDVTSCLESKAKFETNSDKEDLANYLGQLSSLIDRGRLLFVNDRTDGYGADKSTAYQGYRPYMLDCLVDIYDEFVPLLSISNEKRSAGTYLINAEAARRVNYAKREFISQVQEVVDPAWFHGRAIKFEKRKDT